MSVEFVRENPDWIEAEQRLARRFGLKVCPANDVVMRLLREEIEKSEFQAGDILDEFQQDRERLLEFSARWYADCTDHDYGEEWNPEEGNQQTDLPPSTTEGMSQGFMLSYALFFLYAKRNPAALADFVKLRRIPSAKKVARDILRVFAASKGKNA